MGAEARGETLAIDGGTPVRREPHDATKGLALWGVEEEEAAASVIRSRSLFRYRGPAPQHRCDRLEEALAARTGTARALAVTSGTAALTAGLVGLQLPAGAEVIVPAATFVASANAVVAARGVPVFAEVDASLTLDPDAVEEVITERTFAIMPVHLGNAAAAMHPLLEVARRHGLAVIEDAAQSLGITYRSRPTGSIGDVGAFSFQQDKNVSAGEGGAIVTDDVGVHVRASHFQDQGGQFTTTSGSQRGDDLGDPAMGCNLRMNEVTAALCTVQLGRLDHLLDRLRWARAEVAARLADMPLTWRPLPDPEGAAPDLTFLLESRLEARAVVAALVAEGMPASIPYGGQPVYATPAVRAGRTPWGVEFSPRSRCRRSEGLLGRTVTVGLGPTMAERDVDLAAAALRKVLTALVPSSRP